MASPAKRRKLDGDVKTSPVKPKGLDYFFAKQKQSVSTTTTDVTKQAGQGKAEKPLTDEQFARKLQAEWDNEVSEPASSQTEQGRGEEIDYVSGTVGEEQSRPAKDLISDSVVLDKLGDPELNELQELPLRDAKTTLSLQSAGNTEDTISGTIPFDESPLIFDPQKYVPDLQRHWASDGGAASYALLTRCFTLVNSTQSRIKIVDTLVNLLRTIIEGDPESLLPTVCSIRTCLYFLHI